MSLRGPARMLYHVSENPNISIFEPRLGPSCDHPVVWAIDEGHLRNYLLPRDCPRVTFFAGPQTKSEDQIRFFNGSDVVVAVEAA